MRVAEDGHLSLYWIDVNPEHQKRCKEEHDFMPELVQFTCDAQIAAAYARLAGHRVTFVLPGTPVREVKGIPYFGGFSEG